MKYFILLFMLFYSSLIYAEEYQVIGYVKKIEARCMGSCNITILTPDNHT